MKPCAKCKQNKPLSDFHIRKSRAKIDPPTIYYSYCKPCHNERNKISLLSTENMERRKKYEKQYREKNLERLRQISSEYREKTKEYRSAKDKANRKAINARAVAYYRVNIDKRMLMSARTRARAQNLSFNISLSDIKIPKVCPILGIELVNNAGRAKGNSPCLDRIDNSLGYIKGNVGVISNRANQLKSNLSLAAIRNLYFYVSKWGPK